MKIKILITALISSTICLGGEFVNSTIGTELYSSKTNEIIYSQGVKLSELTYEAKNAKIVSFGTKYRFNPLYFANLKYKTIVQDGNNMMNDYDWSNSSSSEWTDWSNHPNTKLDKFNVIDVSVQQYFNRVGLLSQYLNLGYIQSQKTFKIYDGSYIYSSGGNFRNLSGNFSGSALTFNETIKIPYIALDNIILRNESMLNFKIKYSPSVSIKYNDSHHMRDLTSDGIHTSKMFGYELDYKHKINPQYNLGANYNYTKYSESIGNLQQTNNGVTTNSMSSGFKSKENSLSFYLEYKFLKKQK